MRLLIDNNLPPGLVAALSDWDVVHAQQLGLQAAPDQVLFDLAAQEKRIVVSQDADYSPRWKCGFRARSAHFRDSQVQKIQW